MVGVDVDQFAIQAYGPFKQRDQGAQGSGVKTLEGDCQVLASAITEGRAGSLQQALQHIPRIFPVQGLDSLRIIQALDEDYEKVV